MRKAKPTVHYQGEEHEEGDCFNLPTSAMNMKHTKTNTYSVKMYFCMCDNTTRIVSTPHQLLTLCASSSSADVVAKKKKIVFQSGLVRELIHPAATHSCA